MKFSHIFSKLYNRLFTMEDYKYLPPKFSCALKDLALDFGVFERSDAMSMVSGGSNYSMTTASGFNGSIKEHSMRDVPLSPIKETMPQPKAGPYSALRSSSNH